MELAVLVKPISVLSDYRRLPPDGKRVIADNIRLIIGRNDCSQKIYERGTWVERENDEKPTL